MEGRDLPLRDEAGAVPEDQSDDVEGHRLGQRVEAVAPDGVPVRVAKGSFESLAVNVQAVRLTGERRDGLDSSGSFTSNLSGVFMCPLVLLVFENDDTLQGDTFSIARRENA